MYGGQGQRQGWRERQGPDPKGSGQATCLVSQTGWLKTTETLTLTVPESRNPKSASRHQYPSVSGAALPRGALEDTLLPASSSIWWLVASPDFSPMAPTSPSVVLASPLLSVLPFSVCGTVPFSASYEDTCDGT